MFASNFPVSSINITFDNLFLNFKKIVQNFSLDEKNLLFSKTAMELTILIKIIFIIDNSYLQIIN